MYYCQGVFSDSFDMFENKGKKCPNSRRLSRQESSRYRCAISGIKAVSASVHSLLLIY